MTDEQKITAWLTEAFQPYKFDNFTLNFPDFDKNGGFAGEMNYADVLAYKNGEQKVIQVIIKKNKDSDVIMNKLSMREIYANEVEFYSEILPLFEKFAEENKASPFVDIPHCYGTIHKQDLYVIILENLKPKCFRTHKLQEPLDMDHVKLVLEAYGTWHAFSLAFRDQKPRVFDTLVTRMKENRMTDLMKNTFKHEIDETIELFRSKNKIHVIDKLKILKARYDEIFADSIKNIEDDYLVIRHGDSWNNNYLFHYNEGRSKPDKVVIIDWQLCYLGSPLSDVSNFIFSCCSRKELELIDEILKLYYNTLSKKISELGGDPQKVFPWEVCLKSFLRYVPAAISIMAVSLRMRYKKEPDCQYDIENVLEDGVFSGCYGDGVSDPDKHFEELNGLLEYAIERKWI